MVVVVVALVGLVSTVAASAVSSAAAVQVADNSFSNQREASLQDQRRAVYGDFLRSVVLTCISLETGDHDKLNQAVNELLNQEARVSLIGSDEVAKAATEMTNAVEATPKEGVVHVCQSTDTLLPYRRKFVDAAQADVKDYEE